MVDFFVRENPLLNPSPDREKTRVSGESFQNEAPNATASPDTPVMLDYGEFGFPDEQVMREWTVMGCITVILSVLGISLGLGILSYVLYIGFTDRTPSAVDSGVVATNTPNRGLKRAEVKAFTVDCCWNYPSAIGVTPDGRYMITAGGPRTRADDSDAHVSRRAAGTETLGPVSLDLEGGEDDEVDEKVSSRRLLSYDSRPAELPSSLYVDYLNLGKNGKRVLDIYRQRQIDAEKELGKLRDEQEMDYTDLISVSSDPFMADVDELNPLDQMDATDENMVWKKTRPSVESYPIAFWSMETMKPIVVCWNHEFPVTGIAISPDGNRVVSVDSGGNAILWSLDNLPGENGAETPTWHFVNKMTPEMRVRQGMGKIHTILGVTFTPSGRQFVLAATADALDETGNSYTSCGALVLWDIENWKEVLRKRGSGGISNKVDTYYQTFNPVGKYCDLAYTPNGKYLIAAAAGANAGVYYFDNRTSSPDYGICMSNPKPDEQRPRTSPNSEFKPNLVQGVSHHDFPNAESVVFAISSEGENASSSDKNGLMIVSSDNYGRMVFWEFAPKTNRPREGVVCKKFISAKNSENTTRNVRDVLFSADNKYVMIFGDEILLYGGTLPFDYMGSFRATSGDSSMAHSEYFLVSGYFTPDNKYFFGGGDDCLIRMWRMDELPMDSRFLADRPNGAFRDSKKGKKDGKGDESEENLDEMQKKYGAPNGHNRRKSDDELDEEEDENRFWSEDSNSSAPLETRLPITDQVNEEAAKFFRPEGTEE